MNSNDWDWLASGRGSTPLVDWSFTLDGELDKLDKADESGDVLAVDSAGGLYLLDRRGQLESLSRGFATLSSVAWSAAGENGAAAIAGSQLCWFGRSLEFQWTRKLADEILDVAVDAHGHYVAASMANSETVVFNSRKKTVSTFQTIRPLLFLRFLTTDSVIVGASDYGLICCHELDGAEIWNERLWSNVGDVAVTGDGEALYLARFAQGIQELDGDGDVNGSYLVEGTTNHVSCSFQRNRIAATTLERTIFWFDADGEILWSATAPDEIVRVHCDPLGTGLLCGLQQGRIVRLKWDDT